MDVSWAERRTWTPEDQQQFFTKLGRARKRNRVSYLIMQARALSRSNWPGGNENALDLLEMATAAGVDKFNRAALHKLKAECMFRMDDLTGAVAEYDLAFAAQEAFPAVRVGLELDFAWVIATRRLEECYNIALERLEPITKNSMDLAWPANQYKFFAALALIADSTGDREGARRWATNALDASQRTESVFPQHRNVGLVESPDSAVHNELLRLATP